MRTGWYISVAGHAVLILWILFGGWFAAERLPEVSVTEVSVISEAEYAALVLPGAAPDTQSDAAELETPEAETAPAAPAAEAPPETAEPEAVETPEAPVSQPEVTVPAPLADAVVEDDAPVIDTPDTDIEGSSPLPQDTPAPSERVAPVPQVAPPPDAETAPDVAESAAPDVEAPAAEEVEEEPPAAPEEASDRIVTEAEETPETSVVSSMRPRARPPRPERVAAAVPQREPEPAAEPEPERPAPATDDAVAAALAEAEPDDSGPAGPPLTGGEKDAFRVAVGNCWVVDSGARSAGITVVVGFSLDRQGRVEGDVSLISASGGDPAAQRSAFERARRAILRCQSGGYDLPAEKYNQWRDVEITFNPEGMQFR